MKTYFKDYKSKMQKEEESIEVSDAHINFEDHEKSKGLFLKKKVATIAASNNFLFNFNNNDNNVENVTALMEKL